MPNYGMAETACTAADACCLGAADWECAWGRRQLVMAGMCACGDMLEPHFEETARSEGKASRSSWDFPSNAH